MYPAGAVLNYFKSSTSGIEKTLWDTQIKDNYQDINFMPLLSDDSIKVVLEHAGKYNFKL